MDFKEYSVSSADLANFPEVVTENRSMGRVECEYICNQQRFFCNFFKYDNETKTCTWGKVCQGIFSNWKENIVILLQTDCKRRYGNAEGETSVKIFINQKKFGFFCRFESNVSVSPDTYDLFKNKTEEDVMTYSKCQQQCFQKFPRCNFIHYDPLTKMCTWGKVIWNIIL